MSRVSAIVGPAKVPEKALGHMWLLGRATGGCPAGAAGGSVPGRLLCQGGSFFGGGGTGGGADHRDQDDGERA